MAIGSLLVLASLGGCASSGPPPGVTIAPMWEDYINHALSDPQLSDFEKQVLSDYQVTDAEYQEARAHFRDCMADKGWVVTDGPDNSYHMVGAPGTANAGQTVPWDVQSACDKGTTNYIEPIYLGLTENPEGMTRAELVRACFQANGVPDGAGFSDDQFAEMVSALDYHASTPEGKVCFYDPTGSLGMTVEEAESLDANASGSVVTASPDGTGAAVGSVPNPAANGTGSDASPK